MFPAHYCACQSFQYDVVGRSEAVAVRGAAAPPQGSGRGGGASWQGVEGKGRGAERRCHPGCA